MFAGNVEQGLSTLVLDRIQILHFCETINTKLKFLKKNKLLYIQNELQFVLLIQAKKNTNLKECQNCEIHSWLDYYDRFKQNF